MNNPNGVFKKRVSVIPAAMGHTAGMTDWFERSGHPAANSVGETKGLEAHHGAAKAVTSITVAPVITLASIILNVPQAVKIPMVKVDAQAFNYYSLQGAGESIKRAATVFTECTVDENSAGKRGVDVYGELVDTCSNIRKYMEGKGFVYLGSLVENDTDLSADMAFTQPQYVELMKPCYDGPGKVYQGVKAHKDGNEFHCMLHHLTPVLEKEFDATVGAV